MAVHKGIRIRLQSPAGPLLDVGSYHLHFSAQLLEQTPADEPGWRTLFPIRLEGGTTILLQVMPVEELDPPEDGEQCDAGEGSPFQCELPMDHDGSHVSTFKWDSD